MFHKGLWFQNYRQSRYILWSFWLIACYSAILFLNHADNVEASIQLTHMRGEVYQYNFYIDVGLIAMLQLLLCLGLAAFTVGFSRSNNSLDYSYALPVKRSDIYLSKWMLGLLHIVGGTTLTLVFHLYIVNTTVLNNYIPDSTLWNYYIHQLLIQIGVFSFSLWLGLIGGNFFSQIVFSITFLILPYVLFWLIQELLSLHLYALGIMHLDGLFLFNFTTDSLFANISFPLKLFNISQMFMLHTDQLRGLDQEYLDQIYLTYYGSLSYLIPLLVTGVSIWGMIRLSKTSKNENNGKLLLHNRMHPYLVLGMTICAFLFGGSSLEEMLGNHNYGSEEAPQQLYRTNLFIYYISGVCTTVIVYLLTKKLLRNRLTWK
ncbi:hypothetical protein ACVNS2_16720 [Paenibacillus caseinilyticus]|uniref:ABC transporter permease n=1 Tax=Paenibacillus mucilaginosus K02 TaxID=997761 RepID=I0BIU3_9BACL|nr:acetoin transport permease [Paenibacillus mucilaginosus]AFH62290.1 hypothetical protein B2K_16440 [Paenibacillus mucilaginosus K02]